MEIKDYLTEEFKPWLEDNEQGRVDIKILPYLKDIKDGFYIEAGAIDGLFMSNTKILEDCGWQGLLIEPSQKAYLKCLENRKAITEYCALVSKDYTLPTITGDFFYDGMHGKGAYSSVGRSIYVPGWVAPATVPACTLESLLEKHGIKKVDFLSLDVEGYELEALKGIDLQKYPIKYLLIEVNKNEYSLEDLEGYLGQYGYQKGINLSQFTIENSPGWTGDHQDYLFICN